MLLFIVSVLPISSNKHLLCAPDSTPIWYVYSKLKYPAQKDHKEIGGKAASASRCYSCCSYFELCAQTSLDDASFKQITLQRRPLNPSRSPYLYFHKTIQAKGKRQKISNAKGKKAGGVEGGSARSRDLRFFFFSYSTATHPFSNDVAARQPPSKHS